MKAKKCVCAVCGKQISDVEYIRYGGVCNLCWHKEDMKRKSAIKNARKSEFLVTFQIKQNEIGKTLGFKTVHFAITCDTKEQSLEAISDVQSICDVKYVYINKCGKLKHNNVAILSYGMDYYKCICNLLTKDMYKLN